MLVLHIKLMPEYSFHTHIYLWPTFVDATSCKHHIILMLEYSYHLPISRHGTRLSVQLASCSCIFISGEIYIHPHQV